MDCCALIFAFFPTTTSTIRRKNVERNAQEVTFLEDQNPASTRCGPRRYAVINISTPPPLSLVVTPFEASRQGMVQSYMRTLPVQVDPGGTALSPSLPLCLTPFEASHQEMVQSEIRTQPAQYVDPERQRIRAKILRRRTCFRVLIIGRANAGKTTILQRVCNTTERPKIFNPEGHEVCVIYITLCH